jgi:separase
MEQSDLFIYCGHGAGESLCSSHKLRRMKCPLASWLWGCSSGQLRRQGIFDATGPVLDYFAGGTCQLVANLWDVTDKDIDKLSMECMRGVLDQTAGSACDPSSMNDVCSSLNSSRDVCKLKYAVGSAPVVYGLPLQFTGR